MTRSHRGTVQWWSVLSELLKIVSYSLMYWYMCRLDASHRCPVVNKDFRLSPSTSLSSSWFLSFAYIALSSAYIAPVVLSRSSLTYIAWIILLLRAGSGRGRQGRDS